MPSEHDKTRIANYRAGADEALQLAREATAKARAQLEAGKINDPSKLIQNASIASGVLLDKSRVLAGEPTEITEHRDPKIAAAMLARRLGVIVDSTAVDLDVTAELPAPSTLPAERERRNARAREDGTPPEEL